MEKITYKKTLGLLFVLVGAISIFFLQPPALYAVPIPPDSVWEQSGNIPIYAKGDEHHVRFYIQGNDGKEYTVIKQNGTWYYATNDPATGAVIPSAILVGESPPSPSSLFLSENQMVMPEGEAQQILQKDLETFNQTMEKVNQVHLQELNQNKLLGLQTVKQIHIVFVEFPDALHTYPAQNFLNMIFSERSVSPYLRTPDGNTAYGSARDYWREVSRNQVDLQPITHFPSSGEWFMMPQTKAFYSSLGYSGLYIFYDNVVQAAGITLGPNEKLVIVAAGNAGTPLTVFWPHVNYVNGNRMVLTERFNINGVYRFLPMGVAAHEFGHMLFGIPDYGYSMGYWDVMGVGLYGYGDWGTPNPEKPVHPSAIGRIRAGFADVETIEGEGITSLVGYTLPDVESTWKILHLDNEDNDTDFYLEFRRANFRETNTNIFDSDITGDSAGLVVWFTFSTGGYLADKRDIFMRYPAGYFNASEYVNPGLYNDGYWGIVSRSAFPGPYQNSEIGYHTMPSFLGNRSTSLHHITNIQKGIATMHFDLEREYFMARTRIVSLDDNDVGMSYGNGNGIPEAGERIEVVFRIKNIGSQTIPASQVSFKTDSTVQWVSPSNSFSIGEILPGGSIDTPIMVFDVLSSETNYRVSLLVDNQFSFSDVFLVNRPPVLNSPSGGFAIDVYAGWGIIFRVYASDPDDDPLTYSSANLPSGAIFDPNTQIFNWIPTVAQRGGPYEITFTVRDVFGAEDSEMLTITVLNNPPLILGPFGEEWVYVGETLTFQVSASDPDDDPLTYSSANLPPGADFNPDTQTFSWTPDVTQVGTHEVDFIVSDSYDDTLGKIQITVRVNNPPILNPIGNKVVYVEETLTFRVSASDFDNDPLTYSSANLPSGATFPGTTKPVTFSWTPTASQVGTYQVTFTVADPLGTSDSETISITTSSSSPREPSPIPIPKKKVPIE